MLIIIIKIVPKILEFSAVIATIVGNVILVFLTWRIIQLTKHDKEKTKSLSQLENQTIELQNHTLQLGQHTSTLNSAFSEFIKPNWVVLNFIRNPEIRQHDFFKFQIQNTGGPCFNFKIDLVSEELRFKELNLINNCDFAANTILDCYIVPNHPIVHFTELKAYDFSLSFKDSQDVEFDQKLRIAKNSLGQNLIFISPPERMQTI